MSKKLFFFFFLLAVYSLKLLANQNLLLQKIQDKWDALSSFKANFQQYSKDITGEKIFAKGIIHFRKPSLIHWEYQEPDKQLVVVGKEQIWIYDFFLDSVSITKKKEVFQNNIFFYLSQKNGLSRYFRILSELQCKKKLYKNSNLLEVCLTPVAKDTSIRELHLGIAKKDYQIHAFLVIDDQRENQFFLQDLEINKKFRKDIFQFIPNKGTQIIR